MLITVVLLVLLGLLGIASWLKGRQPNAGNALLALESVSGWIGLVGLVWGLYLMSVVGQAMGTGFRTAPLSMIINIVGTLAMLVLAQVLAVPAIRQLAGESKFTAQMKSMADVFNPYKMVLGFVCLGYAVWMLILFLGMM